MADSPKPERVAEQMPRFARTKKKLPGEAQKAVNDAMREILANPLIGAPKKGELAMMRVHKFKIGPLQLLLAYRFDVKRNVIEAWAVGPHENFYRGLTDYVDARHKG